MKKVSPTKVTIITKTGYTLEISGLSLHEIKDLAGLNGHASANVRAPRTTSNGKPTPARPTEPDYHGFFLALSEKGKKFVQVLQHHPSGLKADDMAQLMGFQSATQIGGTTGGGMSRLAPTYGVNLDNVYIADVSFAGGSRNTVYKPGRDIAKVQ
jgi:hypothetical protein